MENGEIVIGDDISFDEEDSEEEQEFSDRNDLVLPNSKSNILDEVTEEIDELDDEFEKVIAEMHANANLTDIIKEVTTPLELLSDLAVDWFIVNMINADPNIPFNMTPVLYAQIPKKYKAVNDDKDHVQIVFIGNSESVGHYILAHFVASEGVVKIYDSLFGKYLTKDAKSILSRLYPGKRVQFIQPATRQPDSKSCGVFAIAYATTIILGQDPATYNLQLTEMSPENKDRTMMLREHVAKMYESKEIKLFPRYTENGINDEENQNETKPEINEPNPQNLGQFVAPSIYSMVFILLVLNLL